MSCFLSVDDLFTAGLGFDLAGAILLGIGLLASPGTIATRVATFPGYNSAEVVSLAKDRVAAIAGLVSIGLGFVLQAVAYTTIVGGATVPTGWRPALGAVIAAILAALLAAALWRTFSGWALLRLLVEISHYQAGGQRLKQPSRERLAQYAYSLGEALTGDEGGLPLAQAEYLLVKRVFGVEAVSASYQAEDLPPPEAFEDE